MLAFSKASAGGAASLREVFIDVRRTRSDEIVGKNIPMKHWFSACNASRAMATSCITLNVFCHETYFARQNCFLNKYYERNVAK